MTWFDTKWPLIVLTTITVVSMLVFSDYYSPFTLRFWNPAEVGSGFHGRLGPVFYTLLAAWVAFGLIRGKRLRSVSLRK